MIGDNDKNGCGAGRLLKAVPDPASRHPAWRKELAPRPLHFRLPELWENHLPLTVLGARGRLLRRWPQTGDLATSRNLPGFRFPVSRVCMVYGVGASGTKFAPAALKFRAKFVPCRDHREYPGRNCPGLIEA